MKVFMTGYALLLALSMQYNEPLSVEQFNSLPDILSEGQIMQLKLLSNVNHDKTKEITAQVFEKDSQLKEYTFYYQKDGEQWIFKG